MAKDLCEFRKKLEALLATAKQKNDWARHDGNDHNQLIYSTQVSTISEILLELPQMELEE